MIKNYFSLSFQWPTQEPFLFCVHHLDYYPKGNDQFGPDKKLLLHRNLGQDFELKDGFRMYHGEEVPGFPVHPHRGFETITIVRQGFVDHADSLGASGRYGEGDVQWMTAGAGVQHSEMFPLLHKNQSNTCELFQIWINLPQKSKMVPAHFKMFWSENIPQFKKDNTCVTVIAGQYQNIKSLNPPPDSWASQPENEVVILLVKMKSNEVFKLPATQQFANRTLYFFEGKSLDLNNIKIEANTGLNLESQIDLEIKSNSTDVEFLILQARPIGEPTFQHGPFVMNSKEQIYQTIQDYQRTQFGGWPWPKHDMVHGPDLQRFAQYPNGKVETPGQEHA